MTVRHMVFVHDSPLMCLLGFWDLKVASTVEGIMDNRAVGISGSLGRGGEDYHRVTECRC